MYVNRLSQMLEISTEVWAQKKLKKLQNLRSKQLLKEMNLEGTVSTMVLQISMLMKILEAR